MNVKGVLREARRDSKYEPESRWLNSNYKYHFCSVFNLSALFSHYICLRIGISPCIPPIPG